MLPTQQRNTKHWRLDRRFMSIHFPGVIGSRRTLLKSSTTMRYLSTEETVVPTLMDNGQLPLATRPQSCSCMTNKAYKPLFLTPRDPSFISMRLDSQPKIIVVVLNNFLTLALCGFASSEGKRRVLAEFYPPQDRSPFSLNASKTMEAKGHR